MPGTLALVGAGEYLDTMRSVDQHLLAAVAEPVKRVVVLPTAAGQEPDHEKWSRMGVVHFERLQAEVRPVLVITREDAERDDLAEQVAWANLVYLSGGSPVYLLSTLEGTKVWAAMREVWARGGVIAGCSAGAMALAGAVRARRELPLELRPGLGMVPGTIVVPHFDRMSSERLAAYVQHLPHDLMLIGVDEHTAAVGGPRSWSVMGSGRVVVVAQGKERRYVAGDTFVLPE